MCHPLIAVSRHANFAACLALLGAAWLPVPAVADQPVADDSATDFARQVLPFVQTYCSDCHGPVEPEAKMDLSPYRHASDVAREFGVWQIVLERLEAAEMPPAGADQQPDAAERQRIIGWIRRFREAEAARLAGDPGPVMPRRLNAAEYNYTIHDLTGVDMQPAREFPVDPANEAGFDNSAESLMMTPALLNKYLDAAHRVATHLVFTPSGLTFASHPVVSDTDRDKFAVRQIIDFYQRQNTQLSDYFLAAWSHRAGELRDEDSDRESLDALALERGLSPRYLRALWDLLHPSKEDPQPTTGPLATVRRMWKELPDAAGPDATAASQCVAIEQYILGIRAKLAHQFPVLGSRGISRGSQSLILFRNRQYATHRMQLNESALKPPSGEPAEGQETPEDAPSSPAAQDVASPADDKADPNGSKVQATAASIESAGAPPLSPVDRDLVLPAAATDRALFIESCREFCRVFPDAFYVAQRGREFLDRDAAELAEEQKVRLLSAGFHSMMGYFRDDQPLYELMLDTQQQQTLDRLWRELDFITSAPIRQHAGFIWYERAESRFLISEEFDFARSEDRDSTSEHKLQQLAELYLAKAERLGSSEIVMQAVREHFANTNANIRWLERAQAEAEPLHVEALVALAARAYRHPLQPEEAADLRAFYTTLRERDGLTHEDAIRDALVSVLVSPHFCYVVRPLDNVADATRPAPVDSPVPTRSTEPSAPLSTAARPLNDYALASRLSYFLWSGPPDDSLLAHAAAGELHQPDILLAEVRRMLRDERMSRWATEFGGQWLDFRQFEQHNSVDRQRFPSFNDRLREAMFQEPIQFLKHLVQEEGSILDCLYGDYTFVNETLASHYGMQRPAPSADGAEVGDGGGKQLPTAADAHSTQSGEVGADQSWRRVNGATEYDRGGLLPMSVFLTKNSPGLRTSPVKRGYWVVKQLLGERIPPPPPGVPELPSDEADLGALTLREVLAKHREHVSCAGCHERFDSLGLVFEGFGPVGEQRSLDLGGRPVETVAAWPDGTSGTGVNGLRDYLRRQRQDDFLDNLCRKLLAYGLGRTLILPDDVTLRAMRARLENDNYRFNGLIELIVTSPQFLNQRISDFQTQEPNHDQPQ